MEWGSPQGRMGAKCGCRSALGRRHTAFSRTGRTLQRGRGCGYDKCEGISSPAYQHALTAYCHTLGSSVSDCFNTSHSVPTAFCSFGASLFAIPTVNWLPGL